MTPEQIIQKFNAALIMRKGTIAATAEAVEDINQLCRDMCDKQKKECGNLRPPNGATFYKDHIEAIANAPYPKELL